MLAVQLNQNQGRNVVSNRKLQTSVFRKAGCFGKMSLEHFKQYPVGYGVFARSSSVKVISRIG